MHVMYAQLKTGRDKPVRLGHPWVFSGAVASWSGNPSSGSVVDIRSAEGEWLARGLADPEGQLAIRIYTRNEDEPIDAGLFQNKLEQALLRRERELIPGEPDTDCFRLCFSESDGLSGLIVDRYADHAVMRVGTTLLEPYVRGLSEVLAARGLQPVVQRETEVPSGAGSGPAAENGSTSNHDLNVDICESAFHYRVDLATGQKTGFYLDQRVNRRRVAAYGPGRRCLGGFCYTGGFELHLARAGATAITGLDRSEPAIDQARVNQQKNPGGVEIDFQVADVPETLRRYRDRRTMFDLIVLDPPKFVHNRSQLDKGLRAYKDINLLAMKLLSPGGILASFSCSGWVKRESFLTALAWAAEDAGREVQVLEQLGQPPDHPVLLSFPESDYLCGVIARVL